MIDTDENGNIRFSTTEEEAENMFKDMEEPDESECTQRMTKEARKHYRETLSRMSRKPGIKLMDAVKGREV